MNWYRYHLIYKDTDYILMLSEQDIEEFIYQRYNKSELSGRIRNICAKDKTKMNDVIDMLSQVDGWDDFVLDTFFDDKARGLVEVNCCEWFWKNEKKAKQKHREVKDH